MKQSKAALYLLYLIGVIMVLTGTLKIVGGDEAAGEFGNATAPYILAAVQYLIAVAIFLPKTRLLGIILSASYFGGVICFQWLVEGEIPIIGIVVNTFLYAGAVGHYPALLNGAKEKVATHDAR